MIDVSVLREIDPAARIAPDAVVGAYCVVGPHVTIGPGSVLSPARHHPRAHVRRVGQLHLRGLRARRRAPGPQVRRRADPADYRAPQPVRREVTAHIGTEAGGYVTRIGNDNLIMDGSHVVHDCYVDDRVRLGRRVLLAGHAHVETGAVIEELCGLHHFVTVGRFSRMGPHTPVRRDVPPFTDFGGLDEDRTAPPAVRGIHEAGIAAADLGPDEQRELRFALRELFDDESALQTKIEQLTNMGVEGEAARLCEFCNRSLKGPYGRYRELFRGQVPPEAKEYLPPETGMDPRRPVA